MYLYKKKTMISNRYHSWFEIKLGMLNIQTEIAGIWFENKNLKSFISDTSWKITLCIHILSGIWWASGDGGIWAAAPFLISLNKLQQHVF